MTGVANKDSLRFPFCDYVPCFLRAGRAYAERKTPELVQVFLRAAWRRAAVPGNCGCALAGWLHTAAWRQASGSRLRCGAGPVLIECISQAGRFHIGTWLSCAVVRRDRLEIVSTDWAAPSSVTGRDDQGRRLPVLMTPISSASLKCCCRMTDGGSYLDAFPP